VWECGWLEVCELANGERTNEEEGRLECHVPMCVYYIPTLGQSLMKGDTNYIWN